MLRHMAVLVSGTAVAQLIGVLAAPVLSRMYTPEDFGVLGTLLAITLVISVTSSFKYEMAIVLEKDDRKAEVLQLLCLIILLTITLLASAGFYLAPLWLKGLADKPELVRILPLGSLIILLSGLYNIFTFRLNREKQYKQLAKAAIAQRIGTVLTQVVLGYIGAASLGLVAGNLLGCLLSVLILVPFIINETTTFRATRQELKGVALIHYRFAAYSMPQNLMSSLSLNMPIYLLGYFFGIKIVGSYFFALRLLQLPSALIGQSVRQVFYKEAAEIINEPMRLYRLFIKTTAGLSCIAIPMMAIIFCAGPFLFSFVFGADWLQAGELSRWMVLSVGISFINPPATSLLNVLNMQKQFAIYEFSLLVVRIVALSVGGMFWSEIEAVVAYSMVGVVFNLGMLLWVGVFLRKLSLKLQHG